jgi:hypothetical protein
VAQSGHAETSAILSAFGGKADISEQSPDNRNFMRTRPRMSAEPGFSKQRALELKQLSVQPLDVGSEA